MNKLLLPAQLNSVNDRVDRSSKLIFDTRELSNNEFNQLRDVRGLEGWLLFSINPVQEADIPNVQAEIEGKTPAQRLRAVMYLLHKQEGIQLDFDLFYKSEYEKIISHFKNKLS